MSGTAQAAAQGAPEAGTGEEVATDTQAPESGSDTQNAPAAGSQAPDNHNPAGAEAEADKPWYDGMPEESHEALSAFESLDEAVAAANRGKDYVPATSLEEYELTSPEWAADTETAMDGFKQVGFDNGIPPQALQAVLDYQTGLVEKHNEKVMEEGTQALKEEWGDQFQSKSEQGIVALQAIDRQMGGEFISILKRSGGYFNGKPTPDTLRVAAVLGSLISEDSLGGSSPGGGADKPVDAADHLRGLGFK